MYNVGIGIDNPDAKFHIYNYNSTASYPTQISRGDILQLMTNVDNALEFGLAGASNTRRSWILSRHSDLSGTHGKYYNTLHLQPDTGNKSQYRGIAIGFPANEHISVGTHLAVNGNVGIGTKNPFYKLEWANGTNTGFLDFTLEGNTIGSKTGNLGLWTNGSEKLTVLKNGDIGIGTRNTHGFKLAVKGKIAATEVKVALYDNWPDFVFYNNYKLPTLSEVEKHIKEKGHLNDIPSAKEVSKNGILLGDMNAKLLQKIEELTLYTIAQEKEISSLKKVAEKFLIIKNNNEELKSSLNSILKRLKKLELVK